MKPLSVARYAFGYKRTLEHLQSWQFSIPHSVRETLVLLGLRGRGHSGTRLFVHENLPQLKYNNPHIKFTVKRHREPDSQIELLYKDGSSQSINTTQLRQRDIQETLEEHTFTSSES